VSLTDIQVVKGATRYQPIILTDDAGQAITTFTSSATLTLEVWSGDDTAPFTTGGGPTASWLDATAGSVRLEFPAEFTETLTPGSYPVVLTIEAGGVTRKNRVATLWVTAAPGSATAGAVYCTFDQVLTYAPWMPRLIGDSEGLQANLAEQRAQARAWLNEQLIGRVRRDVSDQYRRHAPVSAATELNITTGVDAGYDWGPSIYPEPSIRAQVEGIRTLLANTTTTYLMADDGVAARITAKQAIYLACESQLPGGDAPAYQDFGRRMRGEATLELAGWTARIDTDADGVADYEITP
jgi:hypothetical protein